jgi:serine/threonine protein kinase
LAPGTTFDGRYCVISHIGSGGMANVYKVRHTHLDQIVALKLLRSDMCNDERKVKRFKQEAKAVSGLQHPNLLNVQGFGIYDGTPYLSMEYVEGDSLDAILEADGAMPFARVIEIGKQVAMALGYLHQNHVIHRDIKPANVISTADGVYKVVDFGVAKMEETDNSSLESQSLTKTGSLIGTPAYMSPEQSMGQKVDGRSDIYSLGCLLFELATGKPPYQAGTHYTMLAQHLKADIPSLSETLVEFEHDALNAVLQKCLAKAPADRYQSMNELVDDLSGCEGHQPRASNRTGRRTGAWAKQIPIEAIVNAVLIAIAIPLSVSIPLIATMPDKHQARHRSLEDVTSEGLKQLAMSEIAAGNRQAAIAHLNQALTMLRKNQKDSIATASMQEQLGLVLKDTGENALALPQFLAAEKVYSRKGSMKEKENLAVLDNIGLCYQQLGRRHEAAYWRERGAAAGSIGDDVAYPLGETLFCVGRYTEDGGIPHPWEDKLPSDRVDGYSWHGKPWGALPNLIRAESWMPDHHDANAYILDLIAATLTRMGRYEEAEKWAHRIPLKNPELAWLCDHRLARIRLAQGDLKTARSMIEALLRNKQQMRVGTFRTAQEADLGIICYHQGQYAEAEKHFDNAYKTVVELLKDSADPRSVQINFDNLLWIKRGLDLSRQKLETASLSGSAQPGDAQPGDGR